MKIYETLDTVHLRVQSFSGLARTRRAELRRIPEPFRAPPPVRSALDRTFAPFDALAHVFAPARPQIDQPFRQQQVHVFRLDCGFRELSPEMRRPILLAKQR